MSKRCPRTQPTRPLLSQRTHPSPSHPSPISIALASYPLYIKLGKAVDRYTAEDAEHVEHGVIEHGCVGRDIARAELRSSGTKIGCCTVFRCIRYRLVKLHVDDHQSRDGASNASERYFERLSSVLGRAGNGLAFGRFVIFLVSSMSSAGQATPPTSKVQSIIDALADYAILQLEKVFDESPITLTNIEVAIAVSSTASAQQ
jgi:hypothetical protein